MKNTKTCFLPVHYATCAWAKVHACNPFYILCSAWHIITILYAPIHIRPVDDVETRRTFACKVDMQQGVLAVQVFDDMMVDRIQPITQHFVNFLVGCSEAPLSTQQIQLAFAKSLMFCKTNGGDCSTYSSLLKFCVSQGVPEKAVDVWRQIQQVDPLSPIMKHNSLPTISSLGHRLIDSARSRKYCKDLQSGFHL